MPRCQRVISNRARPQPARVLMGTTGASMDCLLAEVRNDGDGLPLNPTNTAVWELQ